MVGVGEMLASAIVKAAVSKLLSLALYTVQGPVKRTLSFKEDLKEMQVTLMFLEAGIADAEKRSVNDQVARLWLKQLKQAAYEISDMFDEFQPGKLQAPPTRYEVLLSGDMAKKMKKMNKKLKNISEQRKSYGTEGRISESEQDKISMRKETTSRMGSNVIVGRRVEKQSVINILLSSNNKASATSTVSCPQESSNYTVIYGLAGVGKTELAKLVFNDERIQEAFPQRAWVYLHQNSGINDIGRAIIGELEGGVCKLENQESMHQHLKKVLSGRCLIVLDNLWYSGQLSGLEGILGSNDVTILLTSRTAIHLNTAKAILFHLETLSDKFSFDLVKQVASSYFGESDIPEIAMKEIVEKCRGVPLALKTVASQLKPERGVKELLSIIKNIFQPKSYGIMGIEQTVTESLKLTYHLMTPCLKLCFAYCAIFPKGSEIDREDLYHQWIALGLIEGSCEQSPITKKMCAEYNVHQLLDMSFLQDSGPFSVTKRSTGAPAKLKMHDLVHDLAVSVADDDLVVINGENTEAKLYRYRYAMLVAYEKTNLHKDLPAGLRALHIKDCPRLKFKWYNSSLVKCLRILDISGCRIEKIPSSLGKLMQLRYLNASGTQSKELPKAIGSLSKLQYLNLHGSCISGLPESPTKLGQLMHLDLSDCVDLKTLPKSFCELECLSLLTLENCSQLSSLPDDLGRLKNLDNLNLSGCSCLDMLPESLGELESLRQLDLSGCKKLTMLPYSFARLTCLQYLNISSCSELDIPVDTLNNLVKLEYVNMSSCPKLLGLPQEFCSLQHLHTLNLSDCSKLTNLPERLGQMKSIRFILLDGCAESVRKPILQHGLGAGLQSLPAFVIETEVDSIRSNISQLEHEKFSELELYRLEKVRTVDEAEAIKLPARSGLRSLGLMWTMNIERFIEDETLLQTLEPPEDLQKFRVQGYMGERFPTWNVEIGSCRRGQLDEIAFMHFPMCNSLPHLGQLANLKNLHLSRMPKIRRLDRELCDHTGALRTLEKITLEYMENLEEWYTTKPSGSGQQKQEGFMFPALQELNIYHCPRLTMHPCPPRSIKWEVRASNRPAQLLLKKDEVMRWLADYMGMQCPFGYTTELHVSGSSSSSPSTTDGWKFHGSLITLKDLPCDSCSLIDTLLGKGSSMQFLVYLEISGVEDTKSLQEQVDTVAYSTRSSLAKSWPDWFSQQPSINNGASPHFMVTGYASCVLHGWIDEVTSILGNLIRINMDELPMCDRLPPLGQLPKLQELRLKGMPKIKRIDRDICGSDCLSFELFFPRLTRFVLNGMPNLEEWATKVPSTSDQCGQEEFMFPRLVKLTIWNCPKLKLKPCLPRATEWDINNSDQVIASSYDIKSGGELATTLQVLLCKVPPNRWKLLHHLPGIQSLAIVSCHGMEALPESVRSLSSLQSLTISKCHVLKHLPEWLGDLTSLQKLMVVSCPVEFLPGGMRRLSFLRSLSLNCCDRMTALPGWLGDLNSLKKVTIEGCNSLKSLPQIFMLEDLLIRYNDELEQWTESEVNKAKFAQIKRKGFWLESHSGSNSYIQPARSLHVLWGHDDRYWRLRSIPESRFAVSMELLEVWWLEIEGSVPAQALPINTSYDVYLVYKLADEHDGLRWGQSYVHVNGVHANGVHVSFVDEDAVHLDGVAYPVTRSEGWMELRLGEFDNNCGDSEIKVGVTEKTNTYAKKGLIVEGMEIRVKSLATS
ncbi:putative disease resistance protein RGA1 isoform X2 [Phragmites australis]|uniref:putative disease resistance protein RGA1 isoform X2 n=1 Tax=Phragmites australis TaxID=29695 RepID=UPI002D780720|nr:putative disease resistance protein RGA1 isoform X2 [Phragmites australis]